MLLFFVLIFGKRQWEGFYLYALLSFVRFFLHSGLHYPLMNAFAQGIWNLHYLLLHTVILSTGFGRLRSLLAPIVEGSVESVWFLCQNPLSLAPVLGWLVGWVPQVGFPSFSQLLMTSISSTLLYVLCLPGMGI